MPTQVSAKPVTAGASLPMARCPGAGAKILLEESSGHHPQNHSWEELQGHRNGLLNFQLTNFSSHLAKRCKFQNQILLDYILLANS